MKDKPQPTPEQLAALRRYAAKYGNSWKFKLQGAWMNGSDANEVDGHLLRQVRNTLGPSWLSTFKLKELS